MTYTPNSFVGVIYGLSFLAGAMYGTRRQAGLKADAKAHLTHDIKSTVVAERKKFYDNGFADGKIAALPPTGKKAYADEIEELFGELLGDEILA
eukprot:gene4644-5802_t